MCTIIIIINIQYNFINANFTKNYLKLYNKKNLFYIYYKSYFVRNCRVRFENIVNIISLFGIFNT